MLSEERLLAHVTEDIGEDFVRCHLRAIQTEIKKAVWVVTTDGKEAYQRWYADFADVLQHGEQFVRQSILSDWLIRWFFERRYRKALALFNDDLKIQHAVFKAVQREFGD